MNSAGFEHEIFDMILRMEEKRRSQLQQQRGNKNGDKKSKKGKSEAQKLVCTVNYDKGGGSDRGRYHKAFSE